NKRTLTLKNILDKYLEMKDREEKMEQLIKQLTETNRMLVTILSHLEGNNPLPVQHRMTQPTNNVVMEPTHTSSMYVDGLDSSHQHVESPSAASELNQSAYSVEPGSTPI